MLAYYLGDLTCQLPKRDEVGGLEVSIVTAGVHRIDTSAPGTRGDAPLYHVRTGSRAVGAERIPLAPLQPRGPRPTASIWRPPNQAYRTRPHRCVFFSSSSFGFPYHVRQGSYASWFTTLPADAREPLLAVLSYVAPALSEVSLCLPAANALRDLCDANRIALAPHITAFGELHAGLASVQDTEKAKVLQSISSVIQALPPDEEIPPIEVCSLFDSLCVLLR